MTIIINIINLTNLTNKRMRKILKKKMKEMERNLQMVKAINFKRINLINKRKNVGSAAWRGTFVRNVRL